MLWRLRAWLLGPKDIQATLSELMMASPPSMPERKAHVPPKYERHHVAAFQALAEGCAEPHQQKVALAYLLTTLCGVQDLSYRPDSVRETDLFEGRRFVGANILKFLQLNTGKIE